MTSYVIGQEQKGHKYCLGTGVLHHFVKFDKVRQTTLSHMLLQSLLVGLDLRIILFNKVAFTGLNSTFEASSV